MLDLSVAYHRYRFVGHEFLTWLWYILEKDPRQIEVEKFLDVSARIGNRVVLENTYHQSTETVIIKGEDVGLEEALLSLKKGGMISEMNLIISSDRQQWQLTVKGEGLTVSGLKILNSMEVESDEDLESALLDRIATCENVMEWLYAVFCIFLKKRLSDDWDRRVVVEMRQWITDRE